MDSVGDKTYAPIYIHINDFVVSPKLILYRLDRCRVCNTFAQVLRLGIHV